MTKILELMEFSKTNEFSDIPREAMDIITQVGYFLPSDKYLDSLFVKLDTINVRDVLDEILTSGNIMVTYPMYKIRLEFLTVYKRDLKNDSVSFDNHTFIFTDACNRHKNAAIKHYGNDDAAKEYFSSVYTLANRVQVIVDDLNIVLNYIEEEVLGSSRSNKNSNEDEKPINREIKEEELKQYFTLNFRGGGNSTSHTDYFTSYLIPDLRQERNDKDFARIALLIYKSGKLNNKMKPATFAEWYKTFCNLIGCTYHKGYKPANLRDGTLEAAFSYL